MTTASNSTTNRTEAVGVSPSFSDAVFQNERDMWRAEFDSVGEDTVRSFVEHNCYPPTGMEVARQWIAEREASRSAADVQSFRPLADKSQVTAPGFLNGPREESIGRFDDNYSAIVEIAAKAKRAAQTAVIIALMASLLALSAIVIAIVSSRRGEPIAKQTFGEPPHSKQPTARLLASAVPPAPIGQVSAIAPGTAQKEQLSSPSQIISPDFKSQGQTVAETLALIADKLGGEETINFSALIHDTATGRERTEQLSYLASNVTIDPNRCQIGYRWHVEQNGAVSDLDRTVELRLAKSIRVTSIDAEPDHRFVMHADPRVYVVHIARWDNSSGDHLYFREEDIASRVAMATRRAVSLCDNEKGRPTF